MARGRGGRGSKAIVDRELDAFGFAPRAALNVVLQPLLLALRGGDTQVVQAPPDVSVADSSSARRRRRDHAAEVPTRPSCDDDEVRLAAIQPGILAPPAALRCAELIDDGRDFDAGHRPVANSIARTVRHEDKSDGPGVARPAYASRRRRRSSQRSCSSSAAALSRRPGPAMQPRPPAIRWAVAAQPGRLTANGEAATRV